MYQFEGRDWTELPKALGIEVHERDLNTPLPEYWAYEEQIADDVVVLLGRGMGDSSRMKAEHKQIVVAFIESLIASKGVGEEKIMYEAMLQLESESTLLQWLGRNLRGMWT